MEMTLLLNATFEPVRVIPWQRAITLVCLGKVELIEAYEQRIRSVSAEHPMPAVVRLRRFSRHDRRVKFSRANVYRRDDYACQYCGVRPGAEALTLDHVVPRARGGRTEWTNIVACCAACNARKADRTPEQARMVLRSAPVRPARLPVTDCDVAHESWRGYLDVA